MEVRRRTTTASANGTLTQPYYELLDDKARRTSHWIFVIAVVGVIYGGVVYLHRRMPPVVTGDHLTEFSEERARDLLKELHCFGPRQHKAFDIMQRSLSIIERQVASKGVNRFEMDVQRPSGCFDLKFLSSFTLCYYKITNIVVRIGPASGPTNQALMLNCHYDTMPDTPGATDDAVSCTIMMDVLNVLSTSEEPLQNDVPRRIFYKALMGSSRIIHGVTLFVHSSILKVPDQAGPGNSWLTTNLPRDCSAPILQCFSAGDIPIWNNPIGYTSVFSRDQSESEDWDSLTQRTAGSIIPNSMKSGELKLVQFR
ncbi:hypothetical protein OSTOST_24475, partial [Ostertagia ostertagi]